MKKTEVLLFVACLAATLVGCQTDEGVQKGYLTPQETGSSSSTQTASSSSSSESSSSSSESTSEQLPPPAATQETAKADDTQSTAPDASTPSSSDSNSSASSDSTSSASSSSSEPSSSPDALAKNDQRPGGKIGANPQVVEETKADSAVDREESAPTKTAAKQEEDPKEEITDVQWGPKSEREQEKDDDDDDDRAAAAKSNSSAVSSSFSSGTTRIAEPSGNVRGVITSVNSKAKFVVVKYNYRAIPSVGKVLSVQRNGVKVGQIKVTKPVKPPHSTADILDGDIQRGDTIE